MPDYTLTVGAGEYYAIKREACEIYTETCYVDLFTHFYKRSYL